VVGIGEEIEEEKEGEDKVGPSLALPRRHDRSLACDQAPDTKRFPFLFHCHTCTLSVAKKCISIFHFKSNLLIFDKV
jgi:hypothetical protein